MKKILLALFAVVSVGSLCFAQEQASAPISQPASAPPVIKIFTCKVYSVSIGDAAKGIASRIVVIDEKGQKYNFRLKTNSIIKGKGGNIITLDKIEKGDKVIVKYKITKKGTDIALYIKVVR